mgnify:FL=1
MGLFEDVVINAKSAADVVGKKAEKFIDVSKLRINAADVNNEISKQFEALGRVVYDAKKTDNLSDELLDESVKTIDELYEQLDAINNQLSASSNKIICKKCGAENVSDATYCSKCGNKLHEEEEQQEGPKEE